MSYTPYNKLLNFVPATNSVASTGLPTLRCGSQLAKRYATQVNLRVQSFEVSPAIRFVLSADEHFYPKIRGLLKP